MLALGAKLLLSHARPFLRRSHSFRLDYRAKDRNVEQGAGQGAGGNREGADTPYPFPAHGNVGEGHDRNLTHRAQQTC